MEDTRITFETAKLAKEKGCDLENCTCGGYPECICYDKRISQSLLARWLREKHNIHTWVTPYTKEGRFNINPLSIPDGYRCDIYPFAKSMVYDTYEEALEIGLQEGLKLINNK